jgi:hypothetical protein
MTNPRLNKDGYPLIEKRGETFRIVVERDGSGDSNFLGSAQHEKLVLRVRMV